MESNSLTVNVVFEDKNNWFTRMVFRVLTKAGRFDAAYKGWCKHFMVSVQSDSCTKNKWLSAYDFFKMKNNTYSLAEK